MSVKVCAYAFDKIAADNYWVSFAKFGALTKFDTQWYDSYRDVPIRLNPEKVYQVGLDQSTSNCGIFIKDYENTEAYMMEISREKGMDADEAIFAIEMFLHQTCAGCHISHLIYERPIETADFRSAQVLFQLEGSIRSLVRRYDEFKTARLDCIVNSSWRRVVILDEYKQLSDRKLATEKSIQQIFDWSNCYGFSLGSDRDIYEAMGVIFGWFVNSFDALGRPYVRGERYNGAIGGFILPTVGAEEACKQFQEAGLDATWAVQNPRHSIFENLSAAVEKYKVVCVELNQPYAMLALSIECNVKWMDPDKMTVVLTAANFVDARLFKITGNEYHFTF